MVMPYRIRMTRKRAWSSMLFSITGSGRVMQELLASGIEGEGWGKEAGVRIQAPFPIISGHGLKIETSAKII